MLKYPEQQITIIRCNLNKAPIRLSISDLKHFFNIKI